MTERIQKILSARGVCSRRNAEELLRQGRITCNGNISALGDRADPEQDVILVDGKPLPSAQTHMYIMLHKPRGYVTTLKDEKNRPCAAQLVHDCGRRVYPVGRLDMDSEGLLLFTDDGEFANLLMHPSHQVDKTYLVTVKNFTEDGLQRLSQPVELDGYLIKKPSVKLQRTDSVSGMARLYITIHEGRNRQVRRMCSLAGMEVQRLIRIQEGTLKLGRLPSGKWRNLTQDEIQSLMK